MKLLYSDSVSLITKDALRDLLSKAIEKSYQIESEYFEREETLRKFENETIVTTKGTLSILP